MRPRTAALLLWALVALAGLGFAHRRVLARAAALPALAPAPDLRLVDQLGRPFGLRDLVGRVTIVDFVFTRCPDVCPRITAQMAALQATIPPVPSAWRRLLALRPHPAPVRLASISVDPEHDTPERMRAWGRSFGVDPARWSLLTGAPEDVDAAIAGFRVAVERTGDGAISHTDRFLVVGPYGMVRAVHAPADREAITRDVLALSLGG